MLEILTSNAFAQIIGLIAVVLLAIPYQINNRSTILFYLVLGAAMLSMHQMMLGAYVGAIGNGAMAVRNLVFWNKHRYAWAAYRLWPYAFSAVLVSIMFVFRDSWYSIFPMCAVTLSTIALWADSTRTIRFLSILSPLCWIPYALAIGSIPTLLVQLVVIASILLAMWRFDAPSK